MEKIIQVEVRNVYGNELIYPINEPAKIFAEISGKKTLSRIDLNKIKSLGFGVKQVKPELI